MKFIKKVNEINLVGKDIKAGKELAENEEYFSSLSYCARNGEFALFGGSTWVYFSTGQIHTKMIRRAAEFGWDCSSEQLLKAIEVSKRLLNFCDETYISEAKKEADNFLKEVLVKDEKAKLNTGDFTGFYELETIEEAQEFAKGGLYNCYLSWQVMTGITSELRSPLHSKAFEERLNKHLLEVYNIKRAAQYDKPNDIQGFKLNLKSHPFVLIPDEHREIKKNLRTVFGLYA